jgi:YHS domain-containing protein
MKKIAENDVLLKSVQKFCPVMKSHSLPCFINKNIYIDYQGRRIYFCSDECKKIFLDNPDKYLEYLAEQVLNALAPAMSVPYHKRRAVFESMFSTVKGSPQYPGRFLDLDHAVEYFNTYFPWYDSEPLHSGIDYVTPDQCHLGLRDQIVARRKAHLTNQRRFRKEVNRQKQNSLTQNLKPIILNSNPMSVCSVINL